MLHFVPPMAATGQKTEISCVRIRNGADTDHDDGVFGLASLRYPRLRSEFFIRFGERPKCCRALKIRFGEFVEVS